MGCLVSLKNAIIVQLLHWELNLLENVMNTKILEIREVLLILEPINFKSHF